MKHSKNSGGQTSLFEDDVEEAFIQGVDFTGMDLESLMETTMDAWDLVKGEIRDQAPIKTQKLREKRANKIRTRE